MSQVSCIHRLFDCKVCLWKDGVSEVEYNSPKNHAERQAEKNRQKHSEFMEEYERIMLPGGKALHRMGGLKDGWWVNYSKN